MIATNLWSFLWRRPSHFYERHRPEATTLHQVVQENLETLYGAGAADARGRETLLKYVLRPPIAQERITRGPDGLVRIALKKAFSDGTIAVDLDPLSLLTRLCAAVPPPRRHTVRYVGVLASASKLRPRVVPTAKTSAAAACEPGVDDAAPSRVAGRYRPWAELLKRTFALDVLACPDCGGRLRLVAMVTEAASITRYLRAVGEPVEPPARAPPRGPAVLGEPRPASPRR